MTLPELAIKRHVTTLMILVSLVVLGGVAFTRLPLAFLLVAPAALALAVQRLQRDLGLKLRRESPSLPHGSVSYPPTVGATLESCPKSGVHF